MENIVVKKKIFYWTGLNLSPLALAFSLKSSLIDTYFIIQPDQINMAVLFRYLLKSETNFRYCVITFTEQVAFSKVPETHGHVKLVTLYIIYLWWSKTDAKVQSDFFFLIAIPTYVGGKSHIFWLRTIPESRGLKWYCTTRQDMWRREWETVL